MLQKFIEYPLGENLHFAITVKMVICFPWDITAALPRTKCLSFFLFISRIAKQAMPKQTLSLSRKVCAILDAAILFYFMSFYYSVLGQIRAVI